MIDNKERERQHWKNNINNAERVLGYYNRTMPFRQKRRIDMFIGAVDICQGKDILEIGCGTGNFTRELAKTGARIVAVDLSEDLLSLAKKKVFANVEYKAEDAESLSFSESSFDGVVGNSVLHHCNIKIVLKELKRVLRDDGKVVFSEPNMINPHIFLQKNIKFLKQLAGDSPDETAFCRWSLRKVFISSGFSDVIIQPFDFLYPLTPQFLIETVNKFGLIIERIPILKEFAGSLVISATVHKDI